MTTFDSPEIIDAVQNIFIGADEHDWQLVLNSFTDKVLLDYQSMTGQEPASVAAEDIVNSWQKFLPKFTATHHQLGNFKVSQISGDTASVYFYGTATHYFVNDSGRNVWIVVGTYNADLVELPDGTWRVHALKFNLKYMDGNLDLPQLIG